jgi:hypothetical protein
MKTVRPACALLSALVLSACAGLCLAQESAPAQPATPPTPTQPTPTDSLKNMTPEQREALKKKAEELFKEREAKKQAKEAELKKKMDEAKDKVVPAQPEVKPADPAAQPAQPAGGDDMMAQWIKMNSPNENHEFLAKHLDGSWTCQTSFWMMPGGEPQKSTGTSVNKSILGGRYVHADFSGDMMGQPFSGVGIYTYNNATKEYENLWIDSVSTGLMLTKGARDGNKINWTNEYTDPMTGAKRTSRSVTTFGENTFTHEMFENGPDGKEFKTLELVYTKQAAAAQ